MNAPTTIRVTSATKCAQAIERVGHIDAERARIQASLDELVAKARAEAEEKAAPLNAQRDRLATEIEKWCTANRERLTEGERKFIDFPSGRVGWRLGRPRIEVDPEKRETIIRKLLRRGLDRFVKIEHRLNERALLDAPDQARKINGITLHEAEESFWIRPTDMALSDGPARAGAEA